MNYHNFQAMNTTILVAADGDVQRVQQGFRMAEQQVRLFEQRFTRFSSTSELSELNQSAGTWFHASPEMYEVVQLANQHYQRTGGLYDPGILPALEHAGYDRSMDIIRAGGQPAVLPDPVAWSGSQFHKIQFDERRRSIYLPEGLRIDLGGIAKGWIAEQAARELSKTARACAVDAGGDMFFYGHPQKSDGWTVALEDPFDSMQNLALLSVGPGAVATSSMMKRRWEQAGKVQHHLIDPRTGQPADSPWISVTVIAGQPDKSFPLNGKPSNLATTAEVLAKALLIGGPDAADVLTKNYPGISYIGVDRNRNLWGSEKSKKVIYEYRTEVFPAETTAI